MKNLFKISFILVFIGGVIGCGPKYIHKDPIIKNSALSMRVTAVAFSPDGKFALSSNLHLWEISTGRVLRTFQISSYPRNSVAFSPDGKLVLSSNLEYMQLWEVSTGRHIRNFQGHSEHVYAVAFSPDGKLALSGSSDKTLKLWEVSSGREIRSFKGHSKHVSSVTFSPDGRLALSGSWDKTLKLWEVASGREIRTIKGYTSFVKSVVFSPDGKLALSCGGDSVKLWEVNTGKEIRSFKARSCSNVVFSPDAQLALFGTDGGPLTLNDDGLTLLEVASGRNIRSFSVPHDDYDVRYFETAINAVVFSPDGRLILSGGNDNTMRLWNAKTGKEIAKMIEFYKGEWVTMTPQGHYVASANGGKYINSYSFYNQPEKVKLALKPFVSAFPVQVATITPVQTPVVKPKIQPKPIKPKTEPKPTDTTPPRIVLNAKTRGPTSELVADTNSYTLSGQAIDDSKIAFVKVNGKKARVNRQGYFTVQLALELGKNRISVKAADIHNNVSSKNIVLSRQEIKPPTIRFAGNYHALVIGINKYKYLDNLNTAVNDARTVAKVLKKQYGFKVTMLLDKQATRSGIMSVFNKLNKSLAKNDHLLIYYAGHGYFDEDTKAAYWLPADAKNDEDTEWLFAGSLTTHLKRNKAKNILVVADSCYSGTLTRRRGSNINLNAKPQERQRYLKKMLNKTSRVLISSGGNEPVTDSGGRGHSFFAKVFLDGLRQMKAIAFTAEELFIKSGIQEHVAGNIAQTPEYQIIRQSGHQGGDFVFQRK